MRVVALTSLELREDASIHRRSGFDIDREVFKRSKAKFCMIDAKETFETHPNFAPKLETEPRFDGGTKR